MFKTIEQFRKDAKRLGRDGDSVEELKLYIESKDDVAEQSLKDKAIEEITNFIHEFDTGERTVDDDTGFNIYFEHDGKNYTVEAYNSGEGKTWRFDFFEVIEDVSDEIVETIDISEI